MVGKTQTFRIVLETDSSQIDQTLERVIKRFQKYGLEGTLASTKISENGKKVIQTYTGIAPTLQKTISLLREVSTVPVASGQKILNAEVKETVQLLEDVKNLQSSIATSAKVTKERPKERSTLASEKAAKEKEAREKKINDLFRERSRIISENIVKGTKATEASLDAQRKISNALKDRSRRAAENIKAGTDAQKEQDRQTANAFKARSRGIAARIAQGTKETAQQNTLLTKEKQRVALVNKATKAEKRVTTAKKKTTQAQHRLNSATKTTGLHLSGLLDTHKSLSRHVFDIVLSYRAVNAVIDGIKRSLTNIPKAGIGLQATQAALTGTFGTEKAAENLKFTSELAEDLGQNLKGLEESFRQFAPSATLAGASLEETRQVFADFTAVGTILHKTEDEMRSVFIALEQIFSKGTVQSEEIKRQLGNQLPAAIAIGAAAFGSTTEAFLKAMKENQIIAKDFLPVYANLYKVIFAGEDDAILKSLAQKTLANYQRLLNRYETINREIFGKSENIINASLKAFNSLLDKVIENLSGLIQAFQTLAAVIGGRYAIAVIAASVHTLKLAITQGTLLASTKALIVGFTGLPLAVVGVITAVGALGVAYVKASEVSIGYGKVVGLASDRLKELQEGYVAAAEAQRGITKETSEATKASIENSLSFYTEALQALKEYQDKSNSVFIQIGEDQVKLTTFTVLFIKFIIRESIQAIQDLYTAVNKFTVTLPNFANPLAASIPIIDRLATKFAELGNAAIDAIPSKSIKGGLDNTALGLQNIIAAGEKGIDVIGKFERALTGAAQVDIEKAGSRLVEGVDRAIALTAKEALAKNFDDFFKVLIEKYAAFQKGFKTDPITGDIGELDEAALAKLKAFRVKLLKAQREVELAVARAEGNLKKIAVLRADIYLETRLQTIQQAIDAAEVKLKALRGTDEDAAKKLRAEINYNKFLLSDAEQLKDNIKLVGEYNQIRQESDDILDKLSHKSTIISANEQAGIFSTIEAIYKRTQANKEAIVVQEELVKAAEQANIDAGGRDRRLAVEARELRQELELLKIEANEVANAIKTSLGDALSDSFFDFVTGAKSAGEAMKDFVITILNEVARLATQALASQLIGLIFSSLGGLGGTTLPSTNSTIGALRSGLIDLSAKGNAFSEGNIIPFATGGIVSRPTLFPMAGGVGLMGEQGPEAILPLERGPGGDLGVRSYGEQSSGGIVIQTMNISVTEKEDSTTPEQSEAIGKAVREQLTVMIKTQIGDATRVGNTLNPTRLVTSF